MKCPSCTRSIPNDSSFCKYCGTSVTPKEPTAKPSRKTRNPNGTGSVYKRGNTWTAVVRVASTAPAGPLSAPGIPAKKTSFVNHTKGGFTKKADAIAYIPTLRAELSGISKQQRKVTLSDYWAIFSRDSLPQLSKGKRTNYTTAWNRLSPLHHHCISDITIKDLRDIVASTCDTYYPAHDVRQLLYKLYDLAAADGLANKDLPTFIVLPPKDETEQNPFTIEEVDRLAQLWESGDIFSGYLLVMIYSSMMPGEILKLEKSMINLDAKEIAGVGIKTKTRKKETVVFPDHIVPILQKLMLSAATDRLLDGWTDYTFRKEFYATLDRAGIDRYAPDGSNRLTPYSCRHTTQTMLSLDPENAPAVIARIMRHSIRMQDRYTHVRNSAQAIDAVNRLTPFKQAK